MTKNSSWAEIAGPCHTPASMARVLGWEESDVRDAADQLLLLAVETSDGVTLYPAFQLDGSKPVTGLSEVLRVLHSGTVGRWTWAQWLNTAVGTKPRAIEMLREGRLDEVLRNAEHDAATWRS